MFVLAFSFQLLTSFQLVFSECVLFRVSSPRSAQVVSDLFSWNPAGQNDAAYMCSSELGIFVLFCFNLSMPSFLLKSKFSLKTLSYRLLRSVVYNGSANRLLITAALSSHLAMCSHHWPSWTFLVLACVSLATSCMEWDIILLCAWTITLAE